VGFLIMVEGKRGQATLYKYEKGN